MAVFVEANPPEILRASQKDESYINTIKNELADIVQRLFGNQTWLKVQWLSDLTCVFLYYTLTTLLDNQTLGEEYVGLIQVNPTLRALPSKLTRLTAITLQVLGPRLFSQVMKKLDTWLRNPENIPDLTPKARDYIVLLTELIHSSSFWVGRLNLVLFYMYGKYYRLSQRMAKIHYVFATDYLKTENYNPTFKFIGQMALTHLVLLLLTNSITKWKNGNSLKNSSAISVVDSSSEKCAGTSPSTTAKCSLCWDSRKNTACTPCGHLFCWQCILQWLQTKHECPLCRESVQPSRIVPLLNYE
ncbi:peroxisome biogenesis factor 10-like [Daphnia pulicaria]|uniref:peroxisome biogenesis factor 10-like n=1 Tax=Daphnia pulicaria TaxID=35523 RepID=UPI001EEA0AF1|nr:peroxisome biogenesis factor 10-like [Daphnia pulicaria]